MKQLLLKDADKVVKLLKKQGLTISTAESCTGGLLSGAITAVSGSSDVFNAGIVTYSNDAKMKYLGVKEETLRKYGAVSKETAYEMSMGIKEANGADIGVGITGIAGPTGGTDEKPVGLVYIGVNGVVTKNIFSGEREDVRLKAVVKALNMVSDFVENNH
ncbi:MAG: CinA family protein [Clostridia bacterium]|nr:CinA family protein [Clostridia bacterium]MBQ9997895.1 CinA family protein [Clostridia bacterium]